MHPSSSSSVGNVLNVNTSICSQPFKEIALVCKIRGLGLGRGHNDMTRSRVYTLFGNGYIVFNQYACISTLVKTRLSKVTIHCSLM
jgi:hypothetical protein